MSMRDKGIFIFRVILGATFIAASVGKIANPAEFKGIVEDYHVLPINVITIFSLAFPWTELILGIFLVVGIFIREAATILSGYVLVFMATLIYRSSLGPLNECGCFGFGPAHNDGSIGFANIIVRDLVLLMIGILIIFLHRKRDRSE